jgi:hypothetical protein
MQPGMREEIISLEMKSISDLETATPGKRRLISSALRTNGIRMEKNFKA